MFGIGFFELVVIAIVALVFVGPKRLPEVMKQAGKFFVHIRRTANDVKGTFEGVLKDAEDEIRREEVTHMKQMLSAQAQASPQTVPTTATALPDAHGHANQTTAQATGVPMTPHPEVTGVVAHDPHAADAGTGHAAAQPSSTGTGTDPNPN